jgi:hypothetical protein
MTRQSRAISYAVLYMNLHESKHNSQKEKLQQMSIYYRHCHCATQYSMFRKYFDSQSPNYTYYMWSQSEFNFLRLQINITEYIYVRLRASVNVNSYRV